MCILDFFFCLNKLQILLLPSIPTNSMKLIHHRIIFSLILFHFTLLLLHKQLIIFFHLSFHLQSHLFTFFLLSLILILIFILLFIFRLIWLFLINNIQQIILQQFINPLNLTILHQRIQIQLNFLYSYQLI